MARTPRSTTEKGLGWPHQQVRDALLDVHVDGTRCWWCGLPMFRDPQRNWDHAIANPNDPAPGSLAADHTFARGNGGQQADRLLHGWCNKKRQRGDRDDQRPAVTGIDVRLAVASPVPPTARSMPWPI